MSYIIVWRNSHRNPHLGADGIFLETYRTYEDAKDYAEEMIKTNPKDADFFDYQIYEEANS